MKKRILIFSTAYLPFVGGAEVAVKEITDRLGSDYEFDMVTLNLDGKQRVFEKIGNVGVYRIGKPGKISKLLFPFTAYLFAKKLHKKETYDAVWSIMASYGGFAARFFKKKFPEVPFILTLQEGDPIPEIKRKVWFVYPWFREIFTRADRIQTISNYLADWAREMGAEVPIEVIPNGVDVFWFDPEQTPIQSTRENFWKVKNVNAGKVLITTSRLVHKNAIDSVIRSLTKLPKFHFVILGEGPLRKDLESLANGLGLSERVHFMGLISNSTIIHYLHHSDIFIRPSRSEGMGNSFIEAMAAGIPVIATPVGGIVDFLKDPATAGQAATGLFCNVNDPKNIAEKVMEYVNDPELTSRIVKNAKEMVIEKYDWNKIAHDMKEGVFAAVAV